jgi:tRNA A-37 threonylcarbamoyl transferase component Bud32
MSSTNALLSNPAADIYNKLKSKLVGRTYIGRSNTRKLKYFDKMETTIRAGLGEMMPEKLTEISSLLDSQPCLLELITILIRDAKNYQSQNTTAGLLETRISGAAAVIVRTLTEGYATVLKEQLLASITKVAASREDKNVISLFKDLYTLYYGNCKTGDTSEIDEQLRIKLFTILPESTELGEFIRNVPTHRSCIGTVCSFFSGTKGVRRNATRTVRNAVAAAATTAGPAAAGPAAAGPAAAATGVGIAEDRYQSRLGDWDRYKSFYEVIPANIRSHSSFIQDSATITKVGSGAFGSAFKVTMNGITVIVKVMKVNRDTYLDRSNITSLCHYAEREATVLQKVTGQHIFPDLYASACDIQSESAIIIMESIDGVTLEDWLDDERTAAAKEDIKHKLEVVVNKLHANNFIHRDLKQDNIMVEKNGEVRLIDAGQVWNNQTLNMTELNIDRVQTIKNQINDLITKPNNVNAKNYDKRRALFIEQKRLKEKREERKENKERNKRRELWKKQLELEGYLIVGIYPPWLTPELEKTLTQMEEEKQQSAIKTYSILDNKIPWLQIGRGFQRMPDDKREELMAYGRGLGPRPTWLAPVLLQPLWKIQFSFMEPHNPFYIPINGDGMEQSEVPRMPARGATSSAPSARRRSRRRSTRHNRRVSRKHYATKIDPNSIQ